MAVFEMRNAKKAFGALEVLKGVSLKVEKGDHIVEDIVEDTRRHQRQHADVYKRQSSG